jgi:RNA polymerase sigma-70 factor (ECF subfamily)
MTEKQFRECFEANFEGLFVYAFTLVKDRAEAKDIVQSSYIKLWEKRSNVNEEISARAFLYKVVYRLGLNTIRNKKLRDRHHQKLKTVAPSQTSYPAEEKELKNKMQEVVQALPDRCREIFIKVRIEGMRYREVAGELGISEKTVETQMLRAMKYIRTQFRNTIITLALLLSEIVNMLPHE